jgi:phospholipid/cholesterol/gamma-HCH transport system substrate-binding protein
MSKRAVEIKVGATVIIALVVLFLGYTWYSGFSFRHSGYELRVLFTDVTGLQPADDVRVAGVKKGRVKSIVLKDKEVEVTLWLDNSVKLWEDATFSIMDVALISGTKYIGVNPGSSPTPLNLEVPARGQPSAAFALNKVADLSQSLGELVSVLRQSLLTDNTLASTSETIQNLNSLTKNLSTLMSENQRDLAAGVRSFKSASARLDSLLGSREFNRTLARVDTLTQKLATGEGTLGKLINDPGMYDEMKQTLKNAKELLEDIKAHPRKYINLKIF